jgi:hypothetical protein
VPDKYGFKTSEERRDEARRLEESSGRSLAQRVRRFHELDPAVTDILHHFGAAIRRKGDLEVTADAEDSRWSVRPATRGGMEPPLLDLQLHAIAGGPEFLGVWDLGVDDPDNLRILIDVLRETTNLDVRRLG